MRLGTAQEGIETVSRLEVRESSWPPTGESMNGQSAGSYRLR